MKHILSIILLTCLLVPDDTVIKEEQPSFIVSHKSGSYETSATLPVTIKSDKPIYYRVNGSDLLEYKGKLHLIGDTLLEVHDPSTGVSYTYEYFIQPEIKVSVPAGYYSSAQKVAVSTVYDTKLFYTLDGTLPTEESMQYSTPIDIDKDCTLSVLAIKEGWEPAYASYTYTITTGGAHATRYYYNLLNQRQQEVYNLLCQAAENYTDSFDVSQLKITASELDTAYWAFDYENPQYYWLENSYSYSHINGVVQSILPKYSRTKEETQSLEQVTNQIVNAATSLPTAYDKVKYIHEYLAKNTTYTKEGPSYIYEADGPLLYGQALCEGYSKAFAYLCNQIGIDAICVVGRTEEDHMWNMVCIDNAWYHVDVTADDNQNEVHEDFLCTSTLDIGLDHKIDNILEIPETPRYRYKEIEVYNESHEAYNAILEKALTSKSSVTIHCHPNTVASIVSLLNKNFLTDMAVQGKPVRQMSYSYTARTVTVRW